MIKARPSLWLQLLLFFPGSISGPVNTHQVFSWGNGKSQTIWGQPRLVLRKAVRNVCSLGAYIQFLPGMNSTSGGHVFPGQNMLNLPISGILRNLIPNEWLDAYGDGRDEIYHNNNKASRRVLLMGYKGDKIQYNEYSL